MGKGSNRALIIFGVITLVFTLLMAIVSINNHTAFVIPGFAPKNYQKGEEVVLKTNKITSIHTQIPYSYHKLPVCKPKDLESDGKKTKFIQEAENLGEILMGDRIETSLYKLNMLEPKKCQILCQKKLNPHSLKIFRERIEEEYIVHWLVDHIPGAQKIGKTLKVNPSPKDDKEFDSSVDDWTFSVGFRLGEYDSKAKEAYLFNHVDIDIHYHKIPGVEGEDPSYRIVFFEVNPASIDYGESDDDQNIKQKCQNRKPSLSMKETQTKPVFFTYSVKWTESNKPWSHRWDKYLTMQGDGQIHWFSIINSLMIVLFLTGMVAMIMMRTLHADLRRYNAQDPEDADESGWKLVHGDVFRPPAWPMLFSVLVGSGVQVTGMTLITMVFAVLGFLSPANRGGLTTAMLVLFVWLGVLAGYFSTRTYKMFNGKNWKKNTIVTAFFFPGISFGVFFFLNIFLWSQGSSGGVPFGTLVALIALWFGISVPLCFFGSYFAYRKDAPEQPVRTNQIPRQIPAQIWYMNPLFSILMGGILPFGAVFIELFFILSSLWLHQFYYLFPFLFIVFLILVLTCAEITIVMCYFQLCSEDYHWWWRAYLTSGASAFYMFLYSVFYFATKLDITGFIPGVLYFGYSFIMCFAFFVMTGTIGYYACYFFVRKIYSSVPFA